MSTTHVPEHHLTVRSMLVAVADLDRAVSFYRELGPFDETDRDEGVSVLGGVWPSSMALILRETKGAHYGPQSLGVRSINFSVETRDELDRIESFLRPQGLFTTRETLGEGFSEFIAGHDPDDLPLVFVWNRTTDPLDMNYFHTIATLTYSLDT
jgi:catechol 2,3-dioxygenase-like lactoylglutathione lyase family enzyme